MPTAIIYARVSTAEQKKKETIQAQLRELGELAARRDLKVLDIVTDDGVSGSRLEGRALEGVVQGMESGRLRPDLIIVRHIDRLSRADDGVLASEHDALRVKCALQAAGTKILVGDGGTKDPDDILLYALEEGISRAEKRRILTRTLGGKKEKARQGFWPFSHAPYGYQRQRTDRGVTLAVDPVQAERIRQLFAWVAAHGFAGAAQRATDAEWDLPVSQKGSSTDRWHPAFAQELVRRADIYLGSVPVDYQGSIGSIQVDPIITTDLLRRVRDAVDDRKKKRRTVMMMTGLALCTCGGRIEYHSNGTRWYLRCKSCRTHARADKVEPWIWRAVKARALMIASGARAAAGQAGDDLAARLRDARAELAKLQGETDATVRSISKGILTDDDAANTMRDLRSQRTILQASVRELEERGTRARDQADRERDVVAQAFRLAEEMTRAVTPAEKRESFRRVLAGRQVVVKLDRDRTKAAVTFPAHGTLGEWILAHGEGGDVQVQIDIDREGGFAAAPPSPTRKFSSMG